MDCSKETCDKTAGLELPQDICDAVACYIKCGADLRMLRLVSKTWKAAANLQAFVSNARSKTELNDTYLMQFVIEFPRMHTLKSVGRKITADGLAKACFSLERLHSVDLRACPQVTAAFLERMKDFPNIRSLGLQKCWPQTSRSTSKVQGMLKSLGQLVQLRALDLSENSYLTDSVLASVVFLTNLTSLEFSHLVTEEGSPFSPTLYRPLYSYDAVQQAVSALPEICHLVLAMDLFWKNLSPGLLLRLASQPNVTRSTQVAALDALLTVPFAEDFDIDSPLVQAALTGIPRLLAFLEPEHWPQAPSPDLELPGQECFRVQEQILDFLLHMVVEFYDQAGVQEWIWGLLRAQPSVLASIVAMVKEPLVAVPAEKLLAELAWQARGRAPEQQLLVDAGMVEVFLACIYKEGRRRAIPVTTRFALPWLALGSLEAREGLAADLDRGRGNPWARAGAIDSALNGIWFLLKRLKEHDDVNEMWMLDACQGLMMVMQHSPKGMSRMKEAGFAWAMMDVIVCEEIEDDAIRECALRCLAILTASPDPPRVSDRAAGKLIPALTLAISEPWVYSAVAIGDALAVLRWIARSVGRHQQVVEAGGVSALRTVLESPSTPLEHVAEAAAVVVSLTDAPGYPEAQSAADALLAVLRLPAAEASHAPAVSALLGLAESGASFGNELAAIASVQPVDLQCILKQAIGMIEAAAAAPQQAQREDRAHLVHALCVFAARSFVHAAAVLRQGGVPVLVEAMVVGPAEVRRAAADALWLVAAKGGPQARIAILEARRCLDAELALA